MEKCCSVISKALDFFSIKKCIKNYIRIEDEQEQTKLNKIDKKIIVIQKSSSNNFNYQGDYTRLENYDLFQKFINEPLVKIYINEIFLPNKEIKIFQIKKIKGIFRKIEKILYELFSRLNIKLNIPDSKFSINTPSFDLEGDPPTESDLDCYTPLLFMEFWIYGKSFIKNSKIKKIILLHNIIYTTEDSEERAGFPEYDYTKSLTFAIQEKNLAYIRIVLHHEIFHYIDYADDLSYDDEGWEKLNQENFKYGKGGDTERVWIKLEKNKKGFINHYSTSALEEDRAEIYQYLISCPDEALNNNDIIVRKKAKRIQNFLNNFDNKGIGKRENNFWANLIDYRKKFPYKEKVYQGNICQ